MKLLGHSSPFRILRPTQSKYGKHISIKMKDFVLCLLFHTSLSDTCSQKVNLLIVFAGWYLATKGAFLAAQTTAESTLCFFHILPTTMFHTRQRWFFIKLLLNNPYIFISMAASSILEKPLCQLYNIKHTASFAMVIKLL